MFEFPNTNRLVSYSIKQPPDINQPPTCHATLNKAMMILMQASELKGSSKLKSTPRLNKNSFEAVEINMKKMSEVYDLSMLKFGFSSV